MSQAVSIGAPGLFRGPGAAALTAESEATRSVDGEVDARALDQLLQDLPEVPDTDADRLRFAAAAVGRSPSDVAVKVMGGGEGNKGASGAILESIKGTDGTRLGVMKIYPGAETMGEELSSMLRAQEPDFQGIHGVAALGAARTQKNGQDTALLVMTVAPGKPEDDLLLAVRDGVPGALDTMHQVVRSNGAFLAGLHGADAGLPPTRPTAYLQHWTTAVNQALSGLAPNAASLAGYGINLADLQQSVAQKSQAVEADPGRAGFVHGDGHVGNFFWRPDGGTTMLDYGGLHHSMDTHGQPIGMPAHDVAKFYQELAVDGRRFGLQEADISGLQQDFLHSYQGAAKLPVTQAAVDFFSLGMSVITLNFMLGWCPPHPDAATANLMRSLSTNVLQAMNGQGVPHITS